MHNGHFGKSKAQPCLLFGEPEAFDVATRKELHDFIKVDLLLPVLIYSLFLFVHELSENQLKIAQIEAKYVLDRLGPQLFFSPFL